MFELYTASMFASYLIYQFACFVLFVLFPIDRTMKLAIALLFTAIIQAVVGQNYKDGFELMTNTGICTYNGRGLNDIGGIVSERECFEKCSSYWWCLGISRLPNGWCELDTGRDIACMNPPIVVPNFN